MVLPIKEAQKRKWVANPGAFRHGHHVRAEYCIIHVINFISAVSIAAIQSGGHVASPREILSYMSYIAQSAACAFTAQ